MPRFAPYQVSGKTPSTLNMEKQGVIKKVTADYCINRDPKPRYYLELLTTFFPSHLRLSVKFSAAQIFLAKIGFQVNKRFFGKIEHIFCRHQLGLNQDITQLLWLSRHGFMATKRRAAGRYSWAGQIVTRPLLMNMTHAQRLKSH